jgi:hypothetical protein
MSEEQPVKVVVRVRPMLPRERLKKYESCVHTRTDTNQVVLRPSREFAFDSVLPEETTQKDVYETTSSAIDRCFEGINATILAYGSTGSGKTYTMGMFGEERKRSDEGIVPRALRRLFERKKEKNLQCRVTLSFLEIHKEKVIDLLSNEKKQQLTIREDDKGRICVVGSKREACDTIEQATSILNEGCLRRVSASTKLNNRSSRSHAVLTITLQQKFLEDGKILKSKVHLVDLAGSERNKRAGTDDAGVRFEESVNINRGLLVLGKVINALGDSQRKRPAKHVPYRESKLTHILKDSLGGNTHTVMIACISPADNCFVDTLSTLKYANRARNIINCPVVNRATSDDDLFVQGLQSEIRRLRSNLLREESRPRSESHIVRFFFVFFIFSLSLSLSLSLFSHSTTSTHTHTHTHTQAQLAERYRVGMNKASIALTTLTKRLKKMCDFNSNNNILELHAYALAASESARLCCQDDENEVENGEEEEDEMPSQQKIKSLQQELNELKEELKNAREDLRRDEIIFQRKTEERVMLQERLNTANAQIEAMMKGSEENTMTMTTTTNISWSDTQRHYDMNNHNDDDDDDDIVQYGEKDEDEDDKISVMMMATNFIPRPLTAPSKPKNVEIGPTPLRRPHTSRFDVSKTTPIKYYEEHEAVLLSRTIQMLSQKEDILSSLAHAQICRDVAEERRERCVQTLRSMTTTKFIDNTSQNDDVFELKERIDDANAEIEYNDVAIVKARSKLKRLSAISVQDLISNLTENEARACALVCAREVLDLRKSVEIASERNLELELKLKSERNRSRQLHDAMERRDEENRMRTFSYIHISLVFNSHISTKLHIHIYTPHRYMQDRKIKT